MNPGGKLWTTQFPRFKTNLANPELEVGEEMHEIMPATRRAAKSLQPPAV